MEQQKQAVSVAGAYLALLADRGVDYLFGNAGTDFAPLIEAYAQAAQSGVPVPRPMLATHENLAVAMAHGYGMVSRRGAAGHVRGSGGSPHNNLAPGEDGGGERAVPLSAGRPRAAP